MARDAEAQRAAKARYRERNREELREKHRAYKRRTHEQRMAEQRRRRARGVSEHEAVAARARVRRWAEEHPEERRERKRMAQAARRARKRGAFVEDVDPLVVLERDDGVCGICGGDVDPTDFHVDHVIPLARGGEHSYANTQTAHPRCNIAKGAD